MDDLTKTYILVGLLLGVLIGVPMCMTPPEETPQLEVTIASKILIINNGDTTFHDLKPTTVFVIPH